ncbi:hypothetical protein K7N96_000002 [Salmonella enterica]|nr:hypothetical protein [Salmonella enterica]
MSKLVFTITDAGRQEIVNASNTGTDKVEISSVGIGGSYYETNSAQTTINDEIKKITAIGGTIVSPDTIHVSAKDDTQDEYVVYTVGLYTGKGTLFAVYSQNTAILQKTASTIMLLSNDITFKSLDTANITFGDVVFINPPASESVVGVSRFATAEEVGEGLDPAIAVSAKRLKGELDKKANLDSPNLTGTPTAPTTAESDNSQKIATTAFIKQVLLAYAKLASPNFTGKPTAPTADHSSNDTQIATTAFVRAAIAALVDSSPGALDTLNELAAAIGNDPNFATTVMNALAGKQPLNATLTSLAGLSTSGSKLPFFSSKNTLKLTDLTPTGRHLIAKSSINEILTYLGLGETAKQAAGALQKSQNGADIPDKPLFVQNIGIKDASTTQVGLVRLTSSRVSGAEDVAATANAVAQNYTDIKALQGKTNDATPTNKGIIRVSDSRTSTESGVAASSLAASQNYSDMKGLFGQCGMKSRNLGVVYTNSQSFAVFVSVNAVLSDGSSFLSANVTVDGNSVNFRGSQTTNLAGQRATIAFMVPAGATYIVQQFSGTVSDVTWAEVDKK